MMAKQSRLTPNACRGLALANTRAQLELVRRFTGDAFTPAKGYDARKPMSFGRRMAILKYYRKIVELTDGADTVVYKPKRGEKTSAFNYTGQTGYRKFNVAIVRKLSPDQAFRFELDKSLPAGHQFIAYDTKTGRRFVNLPARLFNGDDIDADEYRRIIETYAPDAKYYLVQCGDSYMWGAGGDSADLAEKLAEVFTNYSADVFDPNNKNSSYYGNWFRGVSAFGSYEDVRAADSLAAGRRMAYRQKHHLPFHNRKWRRTNMYDPQGRQLLGEFENGSLLRTIPIEWDQAEIERVNKAYREQEREKKRAYDKKRRPKGVKNRGR
jgi:hypothetical protein